MSRAAGRPGVLAALAPGHSTTETIKRIAR